MGANKRASKADIQLLFTTLARMARFDGETNRGIGAGIDRALKMMPFFPDFYTRAHGKLCTHLDLLNLVVNDAADEAIEEMKFVAGDFIVETDITDLPSGLSEMTFAVRRRVETGLPLSAEEREQLRCIGEVVNRFANEADCEVFESKEWPSGIAPAAKVVPS